MPSVGIMQGRLSPPSRGRIQSFPVETWREEFARAREAGLDCIEWVYELDTLAGNPLRDDDGVDEVRRVVEAAGVPVSSVCADYFMEVHLVGGRDVAAEALAHLESLLARAARLGASYVVLPFVDQSRLRADEVETLVAALRLAVPAAEHVGVELHLETDLPAPALADVLARVDHPLVRANYDIGNSAALGRDPQEELAVIGPLLGSVHVKDRVVGGTTVPLGTGDADLRTCLRLTRAAGFAGPYILQTARDQSVDEVALARRNRELVERLLAEAAA